MTADADPRVLRPALPARQHGGGGGRRPGPPGGGRRARATVRRSAPAAATPDRQAPGDKVEPLRVTRRANRAGPSGAGRPVGRPVRPAPLCAGRAQPRARRRAVQPAVPGDPGAPRTGLLGVVRAGGLPRCRHRSAWGWARPPSTWPRCSTSSPPSSARLGRRGDHRAGADHRQGEPAGRDPAGLRGLGGPDEPDRSRPAAPRGDPHRGRGAGPGGGTDPRGGPRRRRRAGGRTEDACRWSGPFEESDFDPRVRSGSG